MTILTQYSQSLTYLFLINIKIFICCIIHSVATESTMASYSLLQCINFNIILHYSLLVNIILHVVNTIVIY